MGSGVIIDKICREKGKSPPTEEEVYQSFKTGVPIDYDESQPPLKSHVLGVQVTDEKITTAGIMLGGLLMAAPGANDLLKCARLVEESNKVKATVDIGKQVKHYSLDKFIFETFGKRSQFSDTSRLPQTLRRLAVTRVVGMLGFCFLLDQCWKRFNLNKATNDAVRNYSKRIL